MFSSHRIQTPLLLAALALVLLASCSQDDGRTPVYPVQGTLSYQGKPAEGALVIFHPLNDFAPHAARPHGKVQADATFQLTTYVSNDGAPADEYAVSIFWPEPPKSPVDAPDSGPDRLGNKYSDPQRSKWRVKVKEGTNVLEPFELE